MSTSKAPLLGPAVRTAPIQYDTLANFTAAGGATAYGVGPVWIAGQQYWCEDGFLRKAGVSKVQKFRLLEDFSANYQKTLSYSGGLDDTTNYLTERGARLQLTYDGSGTDNSYVEVTNYSGTAGGYAYDSSLPVILAYYVNSGTNANTQLGVMFSNTSFGAAPTPDNIIPIGAQQPGFHTIAIPRRLFKTWNASDEVGQVFKKLRVYLRAASGSAGDVHDITVLGVFQGRQIPDVVISFDDAIQSVYTLAYPIMSALGLRGSVSVIGSTIGGTYETYPAMTLAQLRELYAAGWELTVHGAYQHSVLSTESAISADIAANKSFLVNNGLTGSEDVYVYPGGNVVTAGSASYNALAANGMTSAWVTANNYQSFIGEGLKSEFINDRYRLGRQKLSQNDFTPNRINAQNFMDCIEDGIPKFYYAHGLKSGATVDSGRESTDISTQYFTEFCNKFAMYKKMGLVQDSLVRELVNNIPGSGDYSFN